MFSLSKSAVGLDISDHSLEIVELQKSARGARIVGKQRAVLPPGIVLHGRIQDAERLKTIVLDALKSAKPKPISGKRVIFGLPEVLVYTHAFRLRGLEAKDVKYRFSDDRFFLLSERQSARRVHKQHAMALVNHKNEIRRAVNKLGADRIAFLKLLHRGLVLCVFLGHSGQERVRRQPMAV